MTAAYWSADASSAERHCGCQLLSRSWCKLLKPAGGSTRACLLECLSPAGGGRNYQARFLGDLGLAMAPGYPMLQNDK